MNNLLFEQGTLTLLVALLNTLFLQEAINQDLQLNTNTFLSTFCGKIAAVKEWLLNPWQHLP